MDMLQELLHATGLAGVSTEIASRALSSIRLRAHTVDETHLDLGATKFGGSPDLPQNQAWPERNGSPFPFVAQINLADTARYDTKQSLPETGRLLFFFDVDAFFETWPRDSVTWSVLYDRSPLSVLRRVATAEGRAKRRSYRPSAVTFSSEITLPDYSQYDATSMQRLGLSQPLTNEEKEAYYEVQAQLAGTVRSTSHTPIHRLLGHPDTIQWNMSRELRGTSTEWLLLLQIDSDGAPGTEWGGTGRIYYWIRKQDLLQCNFSQIQLILQST